MIVFVKLNHFVLSVHHVVNYVGECFYRKVERH